MTVRQIMNKLQSLGSDSIKKTLLKHGVKEPFFGVKVGDLKPIQQQIKKDYQLAKDLYATGNADAMYLAGLIADDEKMTRTDLQTWINNARSTNIGEYTVPWVAAGSPAGYKLALEWIDSPKEHIAAAGWATLGNIAALKPDSELDLTALKALLTRITKQIHQADPRVRHTMNGFIIALGSYVMPLKADSIAAAKIIGPVTVDMNGATSKVPDAMTYIKKTEDKGVSGKKKKTVKC